jgi:hypothetical protein
MTPDMRTTFMDGVRQAAEGTPYVVEETPDGFDVSVDVTEPGWGAMLRQERTRVIFTHHVRMESPREGSARWSTFASARRTATI